MTGAGKARSQVEGSSTKVVCIEITRVTMDVVKGGHDSLAQGLRGLPRSEGPPEVGTISDKPQQLIKPEQNVRTGS